MGGRGAAEERKSRAPLRYQVAKWTGSGQAVEEYVYDPEGNQVSAHNGDGSLLRNELYGPDGRHLATYENSNLYFNFSDWLGTERVRTSSSGSIIQSFTDTPYGMNLAYNPSSDISPMHFTGKQRDYETRLDYFGARYLGGGNNLGRFMSADPSNLSVDFWLPQTWNRYAYTLNNPLSMVDRNGQWPWYIHDDIIDAAYPGLSNADLQTLKNASRERKGTGTIFPILSKA